MVDLPSDWIDLIGVLVRHRVRFLLVGAHAIAAHGQARYTRDFDLFVDRSLANVRRLADALRDFGLSNAADACLAEMVQPKRMVTIGTTLRVDIMNAISGVTFAEAWRGRSRTLLGGHHVWVMGVADLIRNKTASARPKDLADLALLAEVDLPVSRPRKAPRGRSSSASSRRPRPR